MDRIDLLEIIKSPGKHRHEIDSDEFRVEGVPGQPDYGSIHIGMYVGGRCIELKSLKAYLQSFAWEHMSYERVVQTIWRDLWQVYMPKNLVVELKFNARGGLRSTVVKDRW